MYTKKILALLVITLFAFISAESEIKAQENTFFVDAKKRSVSTDVKINKGDLIEVTEVDGSWKYGTASKALTYSGDENTGRSSKEFSYPDASKYSLVGYIGDPKNHFQVKRNMGFEATADGILHFGINDTTGASHYNDNSGGFTIKYKVIRKKELCSQTGEKVNIKWVNKTGMPVRVNWINFQCKEETSDRLIQPGGVFDGYSFTGHVFRVRAEKGNEDLGAIVVKPAISNFNIYK